MIESVFCHLPNISPTEEKNLWRKGLHDWNDLLCWAAVYEDEARYKQLKDAIAHSRRAIASQDSCFFLRRLPLMEQYRIYPAFVSQFYFLDIETTGLDDSAGITCISILNKDEMQSYLATENLDAVNRLLAKIHIAVTFHGTNFDIPRLIRRFSDFRPGFHIDLAKTLKSHKINGELKEVAARFGWKFGNPASTITNGKEAADAWRKFQRSADSSILEDLLIYNQTDVKMLKFLIRALVARHARSIPF